jgi:hypothetical protein
MTSWIIRSRGRRAGGLDQEMARASDDGSRGWRGRRFRDRRIGPELGRVLWLHPRLQRVPDLYNYTPTRTASRTGILTSATTADPIATSAEQPSLNPTPIPFHPVAPSSAPSILLPLLLYRSFNSGPTFSPTEQPTMGPTGSPTSSPSSGPIHLPARLLELES